MTDIASTKNDDERLAGPVVQALRTKAYDQTFLLSNFIHGEDDRFITLLKAEFKNEHITIIETPLPSPMDFGAIYTAVISLCSDLKQKFGKDLEFTYHISPGTSAMASIFVLIAKTSFPGRIIQSSVEYGVKEVSLPFALSLDFIPNIVQQQDEQITTTTLHMPSQFSSFDSIISRSQEMQEAVSLAKRIAYRSIPVLLEGESGTGKELFARAIHNASSRKDRPFIVINCGAIPSELFESELFGYEKGAFTGAANQRQGLFESANTGTVFLDEIGELPLRQQVKLLRVLQEHTVRRIGGVKEIPVDIRVIAATNKNLLIESTSGSFREDLFYRLAIAVIKLPALRDRQGDLSLLVDHIMENVNLEYSGDPYYQDRSLSAGAKQLLYQHTWPGNIRELINTLRRSALWTTHPVITPEDMRRSLLTVESQDPPLLMKQEIMEGNFDLQREILKYGQEWIRFALESTNGNKTKAARSLGFKNYQTMDNWLKKADKTLPDH